MCDNRLRTSTLKKKEASEEKERIREDLKAKKKTSASYSKLIKRAEESYARSAIDI